MSDCCSPKNENHSSPRKFECPVNQEKGTEVSLKTILHHIKSPWRIMLTEQSYYFCDAPDCDVVYFGADNSVIRKEQLRIRVGIKEKSVDTLICYCFGVNKRQAFSDPAIKTFVINQTKNGICSCETSNPSGRCCLKGFPK